MDRRAHLLPRWRLPLSLLSVLSPSLLLLLAATVVEPACKMNVSEPAPDGARLVGENLLAGRPEVSYVPSEYSRVLGGGYVLCTCVIKTCVYKCCSPGKAFNGTRCSEVDDDPVGSGHTLEVGKRPSTVLVAKIVASSSGTFRIFKYLRNENDLDGIAWTYC